MSTRVLRRTAPRVTVGYDFADDARGGLDAATAPEEVEAPKPLREYAEEIPEPGGRALRFDDFPFQAEWYSEEVADAEEVVLAKSAQVGASGWGWRGAVRQADQFGDTGVYIFPTQDHVNEFGDERIEPGIEESSYLRTRIPQHFVHTKKLKRIGRGFLHLRGSNSRAGAQSVAAQFIYFDEYDLLDQTNLVHIERRISGARQIGKHPKIRRLGYPFTMNDGIDAAFSSSDQRVWHVVCGACGTEQPITWEENFRWKVPGYHEGESETNPRGDSSMPLRAMRPGSDAFDDRKALAEVWRCCRQCEASLEDTVPGKRDGPLRAGRWIKQNPESTIVGFHAWRGMVPVTDLRALVIASRATKEGEREAFMVLDLGRPYVTGEAALTDADLARACSFGEAQVEMYAGPLATTMGVDVAGERDLNVQIDAQLPPEAPGIPNPRQTLWCGRCSTFEQVADLIQRFRVHVVAIDSNPERRMAKALRATFPGRVVLVEYATTHDAPTLKLEADDVGVPLKVRVNRTDAIDGMMDAVRQVRQRPLRVPPPGWASQMKALVRKTELDTKGRPFRHYVTTGTEGDDYAHTATYALVATELWRAFGLVQQQLEEAQGHHLPDEEMGFRRVRLGIEDAETNYHAGFGGMEG